MYRYEKKIIQKPKFTSVGIILNILLTLVPLFGLVFIWQYVGDSPLKEIGKASMGILVAISILHLIHRLLCNKLWFDVKDPAYQTEYIELYPDHIKIYDRVPTYGDHQYNHGIIYFEDISHTFIYGNLPKSIHKMKIYMNNKQSNRSMLKSYSGSRWIFLVSMEGYSTQLYELLQKQFSVAMKVK